METYNELLLKLSTLVNQVDKYVNGNVNDVVVTPQGPVMSIAGINNKITQTKYIQKVSDYNSYDLAVSDASKGFLQESNIARITSPDSYTGFYIVNADKTITKIDFRDIYDLNDYLPVPFNYKQKLFKYNDLLQIDTKKVLNQKVQESLIKTFFQSLYGRINIKSTVPGKSGIMSQSFSLNVGVLNGEVKYSFSPESVNKLGDKVFLDFGLPSIKIISNDGGSFTNIDYVIDWDGITKFDLDSNIIIEVVLQGLDTRNYY